LESPKDPCCLPRELFAGTRPFIELRPGLCELSRVCDGYRRLDISMQLQFHGWSQVPISMAPAVAGASYAYQLRNKLQNMTM